jgi:2'-5' RNA ligase
VTRAFLAVLPGPEVAAAHAVLQERCIQRFPGLRWVAPGNLHLTVQFLGDADEKRLRELEPRVGEALAFVASFRLTLGRPGAFGPRDRPRTLWIGLGEGAGAMAEVVRLVSAATEAAGFPRERRPWSPHLTLARNPRGIAATGWEEILRQSDLPGRALTVQNVALVASSLQAPGPVYTTLWSSPLRRPAPSTPQHAS